MTGNDLIVRSREEHFISFENVTATDNFHLPKGVHAARIVEVHWRAQVQDHARVTDHTQTPRIHYAGIKQVVVGQRMVVIPPGLVGIASPLLGIDWRVIGGDYFHIEFNGPVDCTLRLIAIRDTDGTAQDPQV